MSRQFDGVFHQGGWCNPQKCIDKFIIIHFQEDKKDKDRRGKNSKKPEKY